MTDVISSDVKDDPGILTLRREYQPYEYMHGNTL